MTEIVEVAIPLWAAFRCPACGATTMNLDGELAPCGLEECPMSTKVRALTEPEKEKLGEILKPLQTHVEECEICQAANVPTAADFGAAGMCPKGAALYRRWIAWLAAPATS
jgi:hypothetical protein